jgi:hypothetical protein
MNTYIDYEAYVAKYSPERKMIIHSDLLGYCFRDSVRLLGLLSLLLNGVLTNVMFEFTVNIEQI